ncbi:TRAP-type mannitol/chloroaromatic compound transport system substrate-binding protein [Roseibium hamelinense]|uniref:TRAP-type mannitol/chloroaromatic compound transport system substrate-binding protein n=1 Tax=Roseibium hamelinense TaxID=150831 RepID=A0A562TBG7_9HYPH|nr:TRAP transporter substrate-binding protein [Roseibium hamelinense]MTI45307.1 TRAP transporter substrate-binding protein [Roseibium hamelinense]TWI90326.1 TRAP-type mannitol/chloroaromatic compound transport system substrate-binding protein [Roseibium hamelinense]
MAKVDNKKTTGRISRRSMFQFAGTVAAGGLAAPAIARAQAPDVSWRMATSWPKNLPGPGVTAQRICDQIERLSGGRMRVKLLAAGELVPALGVFDAVSNGTVQVGHTASFFWQGKTPASVFFTAVPFGLLPSEHMTWIEQGGGQGLWDELYAPFGIKPVMAGNTGFQMGGWFKPEIGNLGDLQGLKIRMPGLGGEVMRRLGATPVSLPPGELYQALQSGVLDAAEFLGPWSDRAMGFQRATKNYYAPGFHEPNGTGEALFNIEALEALPEDLQAVVLEACRAENALSLTESEWENAGSLRLLQDEDGVVIRTYPDEVLNALRATSADVLAEFAEKGGIGARIYESYRSAQDRLGPWSEISLRQFLSARSG